MLKVSKEKLILVNLMLLALSGLGIGFIVWGRVLFVPVIVIALLAWLVSDLARQIVALRAKTEK